jgi:tRNA(Ile)-lysidine synthetase-like protein
MVAGWRKKKLKRLFQDRRIPLSQRDRLICVEVGGRLVWVETLGPDLPNVGALTRAELFRIEIGNETFGA